MTTAVNTATKGLTVVGLALKDGQLPDGLQVGDHVSVFSTSDNEGRCPRPPTNVLAPNAVVLSIDHSGQHGQLTPWTTCRSRWPPVTPRA